MLELALQFFSRMFVFCRLLVSVCFFNSLSRQSHRDLLFSFSPFLSVLFFILHADSRLGVLWLLEALIPAWCSCTPCTGVLFQSHLQGQPSYFIQYCIENVTRLSVLIRQDVTQKMQHKLDLLTKTNKKPNTPNSPLLPPRKKTPKKPKQPRAPNHLLW